MKEEPNEYRPAKLLDEWLAYTGHGKYRRSEGPSMAYVKLEVLGDDGEWHDKWLPTYVGEDVLEGLQETYMALIRRWHDEWEEGKSRESSKIAGMLVMTYGEGAIRKKEGDIPPDEELDQEMLGYSKLGFMPARIVSLISMMGTASETAMFFDPESPMVERFELCASEDGESLIGDTPGSEQERGELDHALMVTFTLLVLLGAAVDDGVEPSVVAIMRKAKEFRHHDGGEEVWKLLSTFTSRLDDLRNDAERLSRLADEVRGIVEDD